MNPRYTGFSSFHLPTENNEPFGRVALLMGEQPRIIVVFSDAQFEALLDEVKDLIDPAIFKAQNEQRPTWNAHWCQNPPERIEAQDPVLNAFLPQLLFDTMFRLTGILPRHPVEVPHVEGHRAICVQLTPSLKVERLAQPGQFRITIGKDNPTVFGPETKTNRLARVIYHVLKTHMELVA